MLKRNYGVVYTPDTLAEFVASMLSDYAKAEGVIIKTILDPASGECSLLRAAKRLFGADKKYIGIDVDREAVNATKDEYDIILNDAIIPQNVRKNSASYWREKLPPIDMIIANPPWSSEKLYSQDLIKNAGFTLGTGQYDSYVLFIELSYNILSDGGYFGFIIPDSLFDAQNEKLRYFLASKTHIKVIARLGEKIFDEVNRAATVIVCKKEKPTDVSLTKCFRLSTDERKEFLLGNGSLHRYFDRDAHLVRQTRFLHNDAYNFDVDTHSNEEELLDKITSDTITWEDMFVFGRGVEISKTGKIVFCPTCSFAQGYKKKQLAEGKKTCTHCGAQILVNEETTHNVITSEPSSDSVFIYVGENVRRYKVDGTNYIRKNIEGINYKNEDLYTPPKMLIRKTGLGIYCAIDYTGSVTSQTVYILKYKDNQQKVPLEYYMALINSRVVYYFYLKVYGENEWKSHPYLTKKIIYTLPVHPFKDTKTDREIIALSSKLIQGYNHEDDIRLEKLIMKKYCLTDEERRFVFDEMSRLPDLRAVNDMKMEVQ